MNNELEPISCDYLYSELLNPVLPKDEENKSECVWEVPWQSDKGNTVFTVWAYAIERRELEEDRISIESVDFCIDLHVISFF